MRDLAIPGLILLGLVTPPVSGAEEIGFNQDIRPILSEKCIACHGPDANHREAGLRLDTAEGAYAALKEGVGHAIVPGDPGASALMSRILSEDPEVVMPPPKFHKTVTPEERALLKRWIEQGAEYEDHWAYVPLERPEVPEPKKHAELVRNPIALLVTQVLTQHRMHRVLNHETLSTARTTATGVHHVACCKVSDGHFQWRNTILIIALVIVVVHVVQRHGAVLG